MILLAEIDYSIFPPINASLNAAATILLLVGFFLIKSGRKEAHRVAMLGALGCSAVFLVSYLFYHYGVGHTTFPEEYPLARKIYLAILIPHIILAVVNVPLIVMLVIAAFRGRFDKHRKLARFTFPSWLFVSVTGVVIYFMIYQWFPPTEVSTTTGGQSIPRPLPKEVAVAAAGAPSGEEKKPRITIVEKSTRVGDLVFEPAFQAVRTEAGEEIVTVYFGVRNEGDEAVGIEKLVSGCECLSVTIDVDPVPAGGTATITGVFDITKLQGQSERKITVTTSQRERPVFLFTRIETDPIMSLEPQMTNWKTGTEPVSRTVEFRVLREKPIHILSAESKRKEVSCEVVTVEVGRAYDIVLTPESTEQTLLGIVRIETDCEIEQYARPLAYFAIQ